MGNSNATMAKHPIHLRTHRRMWVVEPLRRWWSVDRLLDVFSPRRSRMAEMTRANDVDRLRRRRPDLRITNNFVNLTRQRPPTRTL